MTLILKLITKDLPKVMHDKLQRDIQSKPDVPSKISKISDELKEFVGKSLVSRDLEEILLNSFKRAKLFTTYRLNMKKKFRLGQMGDKLGKKFMEMSGKVLVIKPFEACEDPDEIEDVSDKIKNAYFLPEQVRQSDQCSWSCCGMLMLIMLMCHGRVAGHGGQAQLRDGQEHGQGHLGDRVLQYHIGVDEQVLRIIASIQLYQYFIYFYIFLNSFLYRILLYMKVLLTFDSYLIY